MLPFTYSPPDAYMPLIHAGDLQITTCRTQDKARKRKRGRRQGGVCGRGEMEDAVTLSRGVSGT